MTRVSTRRALRIRSFTIAAGLGHILGEWQVDTPASEVAMCVHCERVVAIEGVEISGRATYIYCDRIPVSTETEYCCCLACSLRKKGA